MKHLSRLLALLILVSAGFFFTNCGGGGGSDPDPAEEQLKLLTGNWTVQSATLNGAAKAEYVGAKLNIQSNKTFSFTSDDGIDASVWPASVNWDFGSSVTSTITRKDAGGNVPLTYTLSGSTLKIMIDDYQGDAYDIARVKSVEGDWVFNLTK